VKSQSGRFAGGRSFRQHIASQRQVLHIDLGAGPKIASITSRCGVWHFSVLCLLYGSQERDASTVFSTASTVEWPQSSPCLGYRLWQYMNIYTLIERLSETRTTRGLTRMRVVDERRAASATEMVFASALARAIGRPDRCTTNQSLWTSGK
jgi:hypothetical protein